MADKGLQILVEGLMGFDEEDSWEEGQIPGTGGSFDDYAHLTGKKYDSFEKLMEDMNQNYSIAPKLENYIAFEDGRVEAQETVDGDGGRPSPKELEAWKRGEVKMYARSVSIYIELVEPTTPTVDEMSQMFGIQK